jgi:hypothetical protein
MKRLRSAGAAVFLLVAALPAGAGELLGRERAEITPFFGYRVGGQFNGVIDAVEHPFDGASSYGALADVNLFRDNYKVEVLWSHQTTGFDRVVDGQKARQRLQIDHFQAGVMQEVGTERARFAVSALVGGTRFAAPGLESEARFSGSVGGSMKLFPTKHLGLRFDARAYAVSLKGATGGLCVNGTCAFAYSGTLLWQGDFTAGVILAF